MATVKDLVATVGWGLSQRFAPGPKPPTVLLYHGVPRNRTLGPVSIETLERHLLFLQRQFRVLHHDEFRESAAPADRPHVLITFDDGFRNNAEVVAPVLRKHRVPATFYVSSRHCASGRYLWFAYLSGLERGFKGNGFAYAGRFWDMRSSGRRATMMALRTHLLNLDPHPAAMYRAIENDLPRLEDLVSAEDLADNYAGMTSEQVGELGHDPLFTLGGHTLDHPFLTRCSSAERRRQIQENKEWLEQRSSRSCATISYPSGDYDMKVLDDCQDLGFQTGYAVASRNIGHAAFEVPRMGIYSPSLDALGFKVVYGGALRRVGLQLG